MRRAVTRWLAALAAAAALVACTSAPEIPPGRLPRFVPASGPPPRVALVLGSGGPRGFAHIGALKALEAAGIHPDLIVGSSVGALVGVLYAAGIDAASLEKRAYDVNLLNFFEIGTLVGEEASGVPIEKWVDRQVGGRPIEALPTRFAAVATRAADGALVVFNHGDAGLAVRASIASPGQFDPVPIDGTEYLDGDVASPVPIRVARRLGARVVIAVDVSAYARDTPPGVPQAWIDKDARRASQVRAEAPEADVLVHPDIGYYAGHDEAYRRRVIGIAERVMRERIPEIRAAIARAAGTAGQKRSTARTPSGVASR